MQHTMQATQSQDKALAIGGFRVLSTTRERLAARLLEGLAQGRQHVLFFVNTNLVVKGRALLAYQDDPGVLLVNDGIGLDIAARWQHGERFVSNLNGTDFTPYLLGAAPQPLRVFLVGGRPDIVRRAAAHVSDKLGGVVVGTCDGYGGVRDTPDLDAHINASGAQVVLVAMGNPIQEQWIIDHRGALDAKILLGVGALFDFWAGDKVRAPKLVQRLRLEWLYRLAQEPSRLLRRYTWDILVFLRECHKHR
jgi:beta-1,4-glucosyltransferase